MTALRPAAALAVFTALFAGQAWAPDLSVVTGNLNDLTADAEAVAAQEDRNLCVAYWVFVRTGNVTNGGTDGTVNVTINGNEGSTGRIPLLDDRAWLQPEGASAIDGCWGLARVSGNDSNPSNNFEAGSNETYVILAPDVGDLSGVVVRMDAGGTAASGWFLESIAIEKGTAFAGIYRRSGESTLFNYTDWLESGQEVSLARGGQYPTDYTIQFQTGTDSGAGTDSDITVRLDGVDNNGNAVSFERVINPFISGNAFENGQMDKAVVPKMPRIERLKSVTITTADNYSGSAWQLNYVTVSSASMCGESPGLPCQYGRPEVLPFNNIWLDGSTRSATVAAASGEPVEPVEGEYVDTLSAPDRCRDLVQFLPFVPAEYHDRLCRNSTDAYRDVACVIVSQKLGLPLDAWVDKCASDPKGAEAELNRLSKPGSQPPPPPSEDGPVAPTPAAAVGGSEEARCQSMVDGQVAYDRNGSRSWDPGNVAALCAGATDADARIACFENRIAAGEPWSTAIPACAADDGAASPEVPVDQGPAATEPPVDQEPPATEPPQDTVGPAPSGGAEEERCKSMLDGQVAWDQNGSTVWQPGNIAALCDGATDADARIACFEDRIAAGEGWSTAIAACAADDSASAPDEPAPPAASSAEAELCKSLLQDQVPWQTSPTIERRWAEEDLNALCGGTTDAAATVQCFQDALYNGGDQSDIYTAIDVCRAN